MTLLQEHYNAHLSIYRIPKPSLHVHDYDIFGTQHKEFQKSQSSNDLLGQDIPVISHTINI